MSKVVRRLISQTVSHTISRTISLAISLSLVAGAPINSHAAAANASSASKADVERTIATIRAACNSPKHVTFKREKNSTGRWIYKPYITQPNKKTFDCTQVGTKIRTTPPPIPKAAQTEAGVGSCVNCKHPNFSDQMQALQKQVAQVPQCKANPQTAEQCTQNVVCTLANDVAMASAGPLGMTARAALSKVNLPGCKGVSLKNSCAEKVSLGLANGIKDLLWGLGYLAGTSVKGVGSAIKGMFDMAVATGKDQAGLIRNLFSKRPVHRTDHTMTLAHQWWQKMSKSKVAEFVKAPIQSLIKFVKQIYFDSLEQSKNLSNCRKWSGVPLLSKCETQAPLWACLSCTDKTQTVCGMLGFATTDIASMFFAGVGVAKLAGRAGKIFSQFASKTKNVATKYLGSTATQTVIDTSVAAGKGAAAAVRPVATAVGRPVVIALEKFSKYSPTERLGNAAFGAGYKLGGGTARTAATADELADLAANDNDSFTTRLQTTDEYIAGVKAENPEIPQTTPDAFVANNSKRQVISDAENDRFMASRRLKRTDSRNFVFRNSEVKMLNSELDFDRSTAITTTFIERVDKKLNALQTKYGNQVDIIRYEGANRLEIEVVPKPGQKLPANLENEIAEIYKRSAAEQHLFLKQNNLVRETDNPAGWYKYGSGPDSTAANLSARVNKGHNGQFATNTWESPQTQNGLKTIYMRAQDVHKNMKAKYGKTALFDEDTGRINSSVADIVSKSGSPTEVVEKLRDIYQFKDAKGRPLPSATQAQMADELIEYIEYTKMFGVEFYGKRTILAPKNAKTASMGSDVSGQNGRNISHNTNIFDSEFDDVARAAESAEGAATKEFNRLVNDAIKNREDVLRRNGYKVETLRTGDDISMTIRDSKGRKVNELPKSVLRELGDCNDGVVCMRDAFVPGRIETVVNGKTLKPSKQAVVDTAHKLEKELRGILPKDKYGKRNFWIEVSPDGTMKLQMSYPARVTADEMVDLLELEELAQLKFRELVKSKKPEDILGLKPARRQLVPNQTLEQKIMPQTPKQEIAGANAGRDKAMKIAKARTEAQLQATVYRNAKLTPEARRNAILRDFPQFKGKTAKHPVTGQEKPLVDFLVDDVHTIGSPGSSVYNYKISDLSQKMDWMRKSGVSSEDSSALVRLGYTGMAEKPVLIPRSDGGFSEARISGRAQNGDLIVEWVENGQPAHKTVAAGSVKPSFEIGEKVLVRRSDGSYTEAVVTGKDARTATVVWDAGNDMQASKTVKLGDLKSGNQVQAVPIPKEGIIRNYSQTIDKIAPRIDFDKPPGHPDRGSYFSFSGKYRDWSPSSGAPKMVDQGWKLHISATPENAAKIAEIVLPKLQEMIVNHKVVNNMEGYISRAAAGTEEAGKFITVYPASDAQARAIAKIIDDALKNQGLQNKDFIAPPGEQQVGTGVYARYGRFTGGKLTDTKTGREIPNSDGMIQTPDGRLIPDQRGQGNFSFAPNFWGN